MITTQVYADDFTNDDVAIHELELVGAGSGRFNLIVGLRLEVVRAPGKTYKVRIYSGDAELAGATAATIRAQFANLEIGSLTIEAAQLEVHATNNRWFSTPVMQARGSTVVLLLETNDADVTNMPCVIKLVEHDIDTAA